MPSPCRLELFEPQSHPSTRRTRGWLTPSVGQGPPLQPSVHAPLLPTAIPGPGWCSLWRAQPCSSKGNQIELRGDRRGCTPTAFSTAVSRASGDCWPLKRSGAGRPFQVTGPCNSLRSTPSDQLAEFHRPIKTSRTCSISIRPKTRITATMEEAWARVTLSDLTSLLSAIRDRFTLSHSQSSGGLLPGLLPCHQCWGQPHRWFCQVLPAYKFPWLHVESSGSSYQPPNP